MVGGVKLTLQKITMLLTFLELLLVLEVFLFERGVFTRIGVDLVVESVDIFFEFVVLHLEERS